MRLGGSVKILIRRERRWLLVIVVALGLGAFGAQSYARLAIPYYKFVARCIAAEHPWTIVSMEVAGQSGPGAILRMVGTVREHTYDLEPAALLISKLQVAAVVQSPLIFWTILLLWPLSTGRQRVTVLLVGVPVFLGLEAATTVCQLVNPLAYASAVLAGDPNPVTLWERWARFLEEGGRVALALGAALLTVTVGIRIGRSRALSSVSTLGSEVDDRGSTSTYGAPR